MSWPARLWRWSWVATLPICCLCAWWATAVAGEYGSFDLRYGLGVPARPLHERGLRVWSKLWMDLRLQLLPAPAPSQLRQLALQIPTPQLAQLNANLPLSGLSFQKGALWHDGAWQEVEVRYRGDFPVHWGYAKKSLRVRTDKDELFLGMRSFNLIVPKFTQQVNNHLGYRLAAMLGVLAPRSEMVELQLNNSPAGVYELVEQLDEGTLRAAGVVPGDLYSGDLIAKDAWPGTSNLVFDLPRLWEKVASNRRAEDAIGPLERLVQLVNQPASEALHRQLGELVDIDAFGRFAGLEVLTQSYHTNGSHNWRLYFDPARQRFAPVLWDPNAWGGLGVTADPQYSMDLDLSRLHALLLTNARFLRARRAALAEFLRRDAARFLQEVEETVAQVEQALRRDPNYWVPDPAAAGREIHRTPQLMRELFDRVAEVHLAAAPVRYAQPDRDSIVIEVAGRTVVDGLVLRFATVPAQPVRARLGILRRGKEVAVELPPAGVQGDVVRWPLCLAAQLEPVYATGEFVYVVYGRAPRPTRYRLQLLDLPAATQLLEVAVVEDGKEVTAVHVEELSLTPTDLLFGALPDVAPGVSWRGEVQVDGVQEIAGDLTIAAGTTVRLGSGAAVIVRGRLLAEGSEAQPIRFLPAVPDQPWGAVALQGRGADGSRLSHCEFALGSCHRSAEGLFDHAGMLTVHDAEDVRVAECVFRGNRRADVQLSGVYAGLDLEHCEFADACADAVSLVQSQVVLRRCRVQSSRDNGAVLLGGRAEVRDCVFDDCGDHGITVGDEGRAAVLGSRFTGCRFGVLARDGGRVLVANAEFLRNATAVDAFRRDWRSSGGGEIWVLKSLLLDNGGAATADSRSQVTLFDCAVQPDVGLDGRRVAVLAVERGRSTTAKEPGLGSFDKVVSGFGAALPIDLARRGCPSPR